MAQEGVYQFGAKSWGPVPIRALASNNSGTVGISLATTYLATAYLAYAGLTADDVELVEFGGFGPSWKGMVEGSVDAAIAN